MQQDRQHQLQPLITTLTFGNIHNEPLNTTPLDELQKDSLSNFILRLWTFYSQHPQHPHRLELTSGCWCLLSIYFKNRNGATLFSEFSRIAHSFLCSLGVDDRAFERSLMTLRCTPLHFPEKCLILGIHTTDILQKSQQLASVKEQPTSTTYQPSLPYIGDPIFDDEYSSQPGTLFRDLLSVFTMQEMDEFEERKSLVGGRWYEQDELDIMEGMEVEEEEQKGMTRRRKRMEKLEKRRLKRDNYYYCMEVEQSEQELTRKRKRKKPTYKKMKRNVMKFEVVKKTRNLVRTKKATVPRRKKVHYKPKEKEMKTVENKENYEIQEDRGNMIELNRTKKRKKFLVSDDEQVEEQKKQLDFIVNDLEPRRPKERVSKPPKKKSQPYTIKKIFWDYEPVEQKFKEQVTDLIEFLQIESIRHTKHQKIRKSIFKIAQLCFMQHQTKVDDLGLVRGLLLLEKIIGNTYEVKQIMTTVIEQTFAKLVASITNTLSGYANNQLNLCITILKEFKSSLSENNSLPNCIQKFISSFIDEDPKQSNTFFQTMNLKTIYSGNCQVDHPNPTHAIISAHIAEFLLFQNQIFSADNNSANKKKIILSIKKFFLKNKEQQTLIMELIMQVYKLYQVTLSFDQWQSIFSFLQAQVENKLPITATAINFLETTLNIYLVEELKKIKNCKNLLNKILKQTFLQKAKNNTSRNMLELFFKTVQVLLRQQIFLNEFVLKEILNGLDPKKHVDVGKTFQQFLLKVLKCSIEINKINTSKDPIKLNLSVLTEECYKQLKIWFKSLYDRIEDDIKHLSIFRNADLLKKTSCQLQLFQQLLQKLFQCKPDQQTLQWILIRHRLLIQDTSTILHILRKEQSDYTPTKLLLLSTITKHLSTPLSRIDLPLQPSPSNTIMTESEQETYEELQVHRQNYRREGFTRQMRDHLKGELMRRDGSNGQSVMQYAVEFVKERQGEVLRGKFQLFGAVQGFRVFLTNGDFQVIDRLVSTNIEKGFENFVENSDKRLNYELIMAFYASTLTVLRSQSYKIQFKEKVLKQFYQIGFLNDIINQNTLFTRSLQNLINIRLEPNDTQPFWIKFTENLRFTELTKDSLQQRFFQQPHKSLTQIQQFFQTSQKTLKSLRDTFKKRHLDSLLSTLSHNLLHIFTLILQSKTPLNKSIQILHQFFKITQHPYNSLFPYLTLNSNFKPLIPFFEALRNYPNNIYKIKSLFENYMQFMVFNYCLGVCGWSYEKVFSGERVKYEAEVLTFLTCVYNQAQEQQCKKTAGFFNEALKVMVGELWEQTKGKKRNGEQLRELIVIRIVSLDWLKQDFLMVSGAIQEFVQSNIQEVCELLCLIPPEYRSIGRTWLLNCCLFSKQPKSSQQSLLKIYEQLQRHSIISQCEYKSLINILTPPPT